MPEEKIPLLSRVLQLLEWMPREGAGFGEIGSLFPGVPPSTISRMLKALIAEGVLQRSDSGGYELAQRMLDLAGRIGGAVPREDLVRPFLQKLAAQTGESAAYFEPVEEGIVLLAKHEAPEGFHYMDEGGLNTNKTRHGFNVLLHGRKKPKVLTNLKDDKPLLVRIAARVCADGQTVGAVGISFFADGVDAERRGQLEAAVCDAADKAGRQIASRLQS